MALNFWANCFESCLPQYQRDSADPGWLCCNQGCCDHRYCDHYFESWVESPEDQVTIAKRIFETHFPQQGLNDPSITRELRSARMIVIKNRDGKECIMSVKITLIELADRLLKRAADSRHAEAQFLWGNRIWGDCRYEARFPSAKHPPGLDQSMKAALSYMGPAAAADHKEAKTFMASNGALDAAQLRAREEKIVAALKEQYRLSGDDRAIKEEEAMAQEVVDCEEFLHEWYTKWYKMPLEDRSQFLFHCRVKDRDRKNGLKEPDLAQAPLAQPPSVEARRAASGGGAYIQLAQPPLSRPADDYMALAPDAEAKDSR